MFLLHGVDPDLDDRGMPEWYEAIERELDAFFHVVKLRYRSYDRHGKAKLPTLRGPLIIAALIATIVIWILNASLWSIALATTLVVIGFLLSVIEHTRRTSAAGRVAAQIGDGIRSGSAHHLIAHSFGTYLYTEAIGRTVASLHHVILTGSVLPCRFAWRDLWNSRGESGRAFHSVRNECSTGDLVARLAGRAWLFTGLGSAGVYGFKARSDPNVPAVHDVRGALGRCSSPSDRCRTAPIIHNVRLYDRYKHNDAFLSISHARHLWLPTLWSYDPVEYGEFVVRCAAIADQYEKSFMAEGDARCEALFGASYACLSLNGETPVSIRSIVEDCLGHPLPDGDRITFTRKIAELVYGGFESPEPGKRACAYPRTAVFAAIKRLRRHKS